MEFFNLKDYSGSSSRRAGWFDNCPSIDVHGNIPIQWERWHNRSPFHHGSIGIPCLIHSSCTEGYLSNNVITFRRNKYWGFARVGTFNTSGPAPSSWHTDYWGYTCSEAGEAPDGFGISCIPVLLC